MKLSESESNTKVYSGIKTIALQVTTGGNPKFDVLFDNSKTTQLSVFKKQHGNEKVVQFVFLLLEDLNNYFNVVRPMNVSQMADLAIEMTTILWDNRIEEIVAFLEGVKKEIYGNVHDRLDPSTIWKFHKKYTEIKMNYFETEHNQTKYNDRGFDDDNAMKGLVSLSGLMGNLKEKIVKPNK